MEPVIQTLSVSNCRMEDGPGARERQLGRGSRTSVLVLRFPRGCWQQTDFWDCSPPACFEVGKMLGSCNSVHSPELKCPYRTYSPDHCDTWKLYLCPFIHSQPLLTSSFPSVNCVSTSHNFSPSGFPEHCAHPSVFTTPHESTLVRTVFLKNHMIQAIFVNSSPLSKSYTIILSSKGTYIDFPG